MPELAQSCATLAGGAHVAKSIDDLLTFKDLDALVIVSPNYLHVAQLQQIAAKRPLPVLCDKPLYTDPAQAPIIAEFAATYPAPLWVAMEYRFPFLPKIGEWNRFNAKTGGKLVEKCCHVFDLMRLILNDEPERVMASAGQSVNHLEERYDDNVPDIWDHGYIIIDFAKGARAMLELYMFAEGARYQEEITAIGPKAKIEALVLGPGCFWPADLGSAPVPQLIISPRASKGPFITEIPVDPTLLAAGDHNGSTFYHHQRFNAWCAGKAM